MLFLALAGFQACLGCTTKKDKASTPAEEAELKNQLSLARKEGIPTTIKEFEATLTKLKPEENAAKYYMELDQIQRKRRQALIKTQSVEYSVLWSSDKAVIEKAKAVLADHSETLAVIDKATALPGCSFPRKWDDGLYILTPELWHLRNFSRLLVIRAGVHAQEGRHDQAVSDIKKIQIIGQHLLQDGIMTEASVAQAIEAIGKASAQELCFRFRNEKGYVELLKNWESSESRIPAYLSLRAYRFNLVEFLISMDQIQKDGNSSSLPLTPEDQSSLGGAFTSLISQAKAKTNIVQGFRYQWTILKKIAVDDVPAKELDSNWKVASHTIYQGLIRFPDLAKVYDALSSDDSISQRIKQFRGRQIVNRALLRALEQKVIPTEIKTEDLISPFTGKPLIYAFDGSRITIDIGEKNDDKSPRLFVCPPKRNP